MANPRVLGYLGRALSHEFSAIQQYLTHAQLVGFWGLQDVAKHFADEAAEEQGHAARLTHRMLELGAMPNASQLTPVRAGGSLLELLEHNRAMEARAVEIYREAASYCSLINDLTDRDLFATLMKEEMEHARMLDTWIANLRNSQGAATF